MHGPAGGVCVLQSAELSLRQLLRQTERARYAGPELCLEAASPPAPLHACLPACLTARLPHLSACLSTCPQASWLRCQPAWPACRHLSIKRRWNGSWAGCWEGRPLRAVLSCPVRKHACPLCSPPADPGLCSPSLMVNGAQVCTNCNDANGLSCSGSLPYCCPNGRCAARLTDCGCLNQQECPSDSCCAKQAGQGELSAILAAAAAAAAV